MRRLRVLAGPSLDRLWPISVNSGEAHTISSDAFDGKVVAYIKGFPDADGVLQDSEYFDREDRQGVTWSIQVQGRFLQPRSADDVLFGMSFDRPLKLPWGTSAALKFMHFIDPTLEHDLTSSKPWALSPLIATMPHFVHTPLDRDADDSDSDSADSDSSTAPPKFPSTTSIGDDVSQLKLSKASVGKSNGKAQQKQKQTQTKPVLPTASKRRQFFSQEGNRRAVTFGPKDVLTTDFCYGFIQFPRLALSLPGGLSIDLMKYWDGQPVRFVCCERDDGENTEGGHGRVFWCVAIEPVLDSE